MKTLLIALLLLSAVLAPLFVLWALRRGAPSAATAREQQNVAAYQDRVKELQAERDAGRLSDTEFTALESEAAAALLAARDGEAVDRPGSRGLLWGSALLVPLVAIGLYVAGGGLPPFGPEETADAMIAQLEARTQQNPHDVEAYANLGQANMMVNRFQAAAEAYARANELTQQRAPVLLVNEGEALALARGEDLLGRPAQLFAAALEAAPNNPRALWYASLAAAQAGDAERERTMLQRLTALNLPDAFREAVDQRLAGLGGAAAAQAASAPAPQSAPEPTPQGQQLTVTVELDDAVANQVPAGATLFVFAKMPEGPPMPLAVRRIGSPSFPLTVTLSEADAMMPSMSLATTDTWLVTARLSASGQAQAAPGDAQGLRVVSAQEAGDAVTVRIDTLVE